MGEIVFGTPTLEPTKRFGWARMRRHPRLGLLFLSVVGFLVWCCLLDPTNSTLLPHNCAAQMVKIDEAITKWAKTNHKNLADVPTESELLPYLDDKQWLVCPHHGKYYFGTAALATTCSIHGHAIVASVETQRSAMSQLVSYLPWVKARPQSAANACISQMKLLDGASQQWAHENRKYSNTVPALKDVIPYMGYHFHPCPLGGKYVIGSVSENPVCTVVGHSL